MGDTAVGYPGDSQEAMEQLEAFTLGTPAIVCRWRLAGSELPLAKRHLRALAARMVQGKKIPHALVAWAHQHIEWTLSAGSTEQPDGVLMLVVDDEGRAAMSCGPYVPLRKQTKRSLAQRAVTARTEAEELGVAPETLWIRRGEGLVAGIGTGEQPSASCGLVLDLASTLGFPVSRSANMAEPIAQGVGEYDEVFLVSDEHGIVPARDAAGDMATRLEGSYNRLLERTREQSSRHRVQH